MLCKKQIVLITAVLFLFGSGTISLALNSGMSPITEESTQSNAVPKITIPDDRYQFSPVPDGSEIKHDFTIKNTGDAPLKIHSVKTG